MDASLHARIASAHEHALALGLDAGDVRFVTVPSNIMYEAASTGLPGHWAHWSAGRNYWLSKREHDAGLSKIYELVIPTDPALALLMDSNTEIINVMVAAHVFGHTHLDRTNAYFRDRNKRVLDTVRLWAQRIEGYEQEHGDLVVEEFIDKVLSLEPYADAHYAGKRFREPEPEKQVGEGIVHTHQRDDAPKPTPVFQANGDLYGFLAQYAEGLEDWQRDILGIYRNRMLYFQPLARAKVLHEGFAALAHRRIMARLEVTDDEWLEYSRINSGVMSAYPGGGVNPYWLGHAILEDIEEREDWERVLEVVAVEDDASLVRNHLTEALCEKLDLFTFRFHPSEKSWIVDEEPREWEVIRDTLALKFSNYGDPVIEITDYDAGGKRALMLTHRWDGRRLDVKHADAALAAIADIWGQRVLLRTRMQRGAVEATAWAPSEREDKAREDGVGVPTDWQYISEAAQ